MEWQINGPSCLNKFIQFMLQILCCILCAAYLVLKFFSWIFCVAYFVLHIQCCTFCVAQHMLYSLCYLIYVAHFVLQIVCCIIQAQHFVLLFCVLHLCCTFCAETLCQDYAFCGAHFQLHYFFSSFCAALFVRKICAAYILRHSVCCIFCAAGFVMHILCCTVLTKQFFSGHFKHIVCCTFCAQPLVLQKCAAYTLMHICGFIQLAVLFFLFYFVMLFHNFPCSVCFHELLYTWAYLCILLHHLHFALIVEGLLQRGFPVQFLSLIHADFSQLQVYRPTMES